LKSSHFNNTPPSLEALKAGLVDTLTTDSVALSQFAKDNPELIVVGGLFTKEPYGFGLPTGDSYFNNLVDFTLQTLKENGVYNEVYRKWFGSQSIPYEIEILPGEWPYIFATSPTTSLFLSKKPNGLKSYLTPAIKLPFSKSK